jgi:hypothetical protein
MGCWGRSRNNLFCFCLSTFPGPKFPGYLSEEVKKNSEIYVKTSWQLFKETKTMTITYLADFDSSVLSGRRTKLQKSLPGGGNRVNWTMQ